MLFLYMTSAFLKYCDKKNSSQVPEFRPNIHMIELYIATIVLEFIKIINLICISISTSLCMIITLHPSHRQDSMQGNIYLKHRDIAMKVGGFSDI